MKSARSIYDIAAIARQHYAEELFDLARIATAIEKRATEGFRDLQVHQDYPFDLSDSPPAKKLEDWLERNHFRYGWHPTAPLADPVFPSSCHDYPELVIRW